MFLKTRNPNIKEADSKCSDARRDEDCATPRTGFVRKEATARATKQMGVLKQTQIRKRGVITMKDLVEVIAKSLVKNPEQVSVTEAADADTTVYELRVAPEDMGKVIGKQGRIAKAIRTVVKAAATRENKKVMVEII